MTIYTRMLISFPVLDILALNGCAGKFTFTHVGTANLNTTTLPISATGEKSPPNPALAQDLTGTP